MTVMDEDMKLKSEARRVCQPLHETVFRGQVTRLALVHHALSSSPADNELSKLHYFYDFLISLSKMWPGPSRASVDMPIG